MDHQRNTDKFLRYLGVGKREPSLSYLNELIHAHQTKVRWETLTKFLDFEERSREDLYLPSMDDYIDRMVTQGTGGTCWTLARGFHFLLEALGFQVDYLYMEPGHLCLQVMLDQAYYVDVGYCAPLYKAYPLLTSFVVENTVEIFRFDVQDEKDEVLVTREPGPTKTLGLKPVAFQEIEPHLVNSYNWEEGFAFHSIRIFGYIDGAPYQLKENMLKRFENKQVIEEKLTDAQVRFWLEEKFEVDYKVYERAQEIYRLRKGGK